MIIEDLIEEWWKDLNEEDKLAILLEEHPEGVTKETTEEQLDDLFNSFIHQARLDIYFEYKKEPEPITEEEAREILGDRKAHEIMVEGEEIL